MTEGVINKIQITYGDQQLNLDKNKTQLHTVLEHKGEKAYIYSNMNYAESKGAVLVLNEESEEAQSILENICNKETIGDPKKVLGQISRKIQGDFFATYFHWIGDENKDITVVEKKGFAENEANLECRDIEEKVKSQLVKEEVKNSYDSTAIFEFGGEGRNSYIKIKPIFEETDQERKDGHEILDHAEELIRGRKITDKEGKQFEYVINDDDKKGADKLYKVLSGEFGVIFKARRDYGDGDIREPCAVRLFNRVYLGEKGNENRKIITREINILETAKSEDSIIDINLSGAMGGYVYYEMPYIKSLGDQVKNIKDKQKIIEIIKKTCKAVNFLYHTAKITEIRSQKGQKTKEKEIEKQAIVHRDIKPSNIVYDSVSGKIYLVDFGLAKPTQSTGGSLTKSTTDLSKNFNFAPEQFLEDLRRSRRSLSPEGQKALKTLEGICDSEGTHTERTDIYGIGATFYMLIEGVKMKTATYGNAIDLLDEKLRKTALEENIKISDKRKTVLKLTDEEVDFLEGVIKKCMTPERGGKYKNAIKKEVKIEGRYESANKLLEVLEKDWEDITTKPQRKEELNERIDSIITEIEKLDNEEDIGNLVVEFTKGDIGKNMDKLVSELKKLEEELDEDLVTKINHFSKEVVFTASRRVTEYIVQTNHIEGEYSTEKDFESWKQKLRNHDTKKEHISRMKGWVDILESSKIQNNGKKTGFKKFFSFLPGI